MMTIQKYVRAASLEEAYQLNQNRRNKVLGGMLWLRLGRGTINTAIDLCDLGLGGIEETEDAFLSEDEKKEETESTEDETFSDKQAPQDEE